MTVDSKSPELSCLRQRIEGLFGLPLKVHSDFLVLRDSIFQKSRQLISETTLERVWDYSTRGYARVSRHTLEVLSSYAGFRGWDEFLAKLKEEDNSQSNMFDVESVESAELAEGDRLRIGWQPDRVCIIRYLGSNRYVAEETCNAKMQPGDTFSCLQFALHHPLYLEDFTPAVGTAAPGVRYGVGLRNGLTMLQRL